MRSKQKLSFLSGIMVSMLATGSKVHGLKPGQGDGFLRVIKNHSKPPSGGEVKLCSPCCKLSWNVKEPSTV
jgi:hypothetical protein